MAYLNTIPAAADLLALSQAQLLENASQVEIQFSFDHSSLLAGAATGKHTQVTLPEFATAVYPATVADEGALFTEDDADTAQPELNYREEGNGDVVKLTHNGYTNTFAKAFASFSNVGAIAGTAYNVASITVNGVGDYTVNFTVALADANYTVLLTPNPGAFRRNRTATVYEKLAASCRVLTTSEGDVGANIGCEFLVLRIG